ncbi:copper-binding protein [Acidobacteriia bacterium AH_259_A11_L15]|nr:copper-binding protein [Acidobacteriia bacterium AH_259_A11_L15]
MKVARTAALLVCLLGLTLVSATTKAEASATRHSDAYSVRQVLEELSRSGPDRAGLSFAFQTLPEAEEVPVEKEPEKSGGNPGSPAQTWTVKGKIVRVDPANQQVTLAHEDIPGLMDAMTMAFAVESAALLEGLSEGDTVEFVLEQKPTGLTITQIRKIEQSALFGLLGLSLVVYGSLISFLVTRLVTYENWQKISSLKTPDKLPVLTPFILCFIVIYAVMEFWRVANATEGIAVTTGWFLYDILALLVALLALQGFEAAIQKVPITGDLARQEDTITNVCSRISSGCFCLAVFLALAIGRFWSTLGINKAGLVIIVDSIGALLSVVAAIWLWRKPTKHSLGWVSVLTAGGFLLTAGYLFGVLW